MSDDELEDECAEKYCQEPATLGMTISINGLRIELDLCEKHFDILDANPPAGEQP